MDIIIFGGQSNMQGQTESLPSENPVTDGIFEYRFITDSLKPLCHPVGEDIGERDVNDIAAAHMGHGTLVPAFCRGYKEVTGRDVVAIHAAKGATTISDWQQDTERYYIAARKISKGIEKVRKEYPLGKIFYVWLQGESDAIKGTNGYDYMKFLISYKNSLVKDFAIDKFGIIKVGYYVHDKRDEVIMQSQEKTVKTDKDFIMLTRVATELSENSAFINPSAPGHYNNRAMDIIGEIAGRTLGVYAKSI